MTPDEHRRKSDAYHEAGHIQLAFALGLPVKKAIINQDGGGCIELKDKRKITPHHQGIIACGGRLAEKSNPSVHRFLARAWREEGLYKYYGDFSNTAQAGQLCKHLGCGATIVDRIRNHYRTARKLINPAHVQVIAEALLKHGKMTARSLKRLQTSL